MKRVHRWVLLIAVMAVLLCRFVLLTGAMVVASYLLLWPLFRPDGALARSEWAYLLVLYIPMDRLSLDMHDGLSPENVDIYWEGEGEGTVRVVHAGKEVMPLPGAYGKNKFVVFYGGREVSREGHFKTGWWHYHSYRFALFRKPDSSIGATLGIAGVDAD